MKLLQEMKKVKDFDQNGYEYLVLDDQMPTSNLSKQNFRNSEQKGLLKTEKEKNDPITI